jgi:hypothetical protein
MANTNGSQSLTKSMNGLIDIVDGAGTEIVDGTITCNGINTKNITTNTLTAFTSITTALLTASNLVINALNIATANITTATITTANIATANIATAIITTSNIITATITTATITTANIITAYITTLYVKNIRSDTPNTAVGLFDTQTSLITMGQPSASFRQSGLASLGLSGPYGTSGTCGLEITSDIGLLNLLFHSSNFGWSAWDTRIRTSSTLMEFDAPSFTFSPSTPSNISNRMLDITVSNTNNNVRLEFHSGSTYASTYDSQIIATGGTGTQGGGTLTLNTANLNIVTPTLNISGNPITPTGNRLEMGAGGNLAIIDFHSGGFDTDYDSRIVSSSGTSATGGGTLSLISTTMNLTSPNLMTVTTPQLNI